MTCTALLYAAETVDASKGTAAAYLREPLALLGVGGLTSIAVHTRPNQSLYRSTVQPRSMTNWCQRAPSVIAHTTSRHSCSDTASCPVAAASPAITPMPA